jgi:hypothetical protein
MLPLGNIANYQRRDKMSEYDEGSKLLNEKFGNGKDNAI